MASGVGFPGVLPTVAKINVGVDVKVGVGPSVAVGLARNVAVGGLKNKK